MAMNEEIERYVREERSRGTGEEAIRHALIAKGWEYKLVDDIIFDTRPGPAESLFTRTFFRFAIGFIAVIVTAVGVILLVGSVSGHAGSGCITNCNK